MTEVKPPEAAVPIEEDPVEGSEETYKLVYDESLRRLVAQEASLDELRSRCGVLIAGATIVTTFLGSQFIASNTTTFTTAQSVALTGFALSVILAVIPLFPFPGWRFYFGTRRLITNYVEGSERMHGAELLRDLALQYEDNYIHNAKRIKWLLWSLFGSAVALIVEVLAWSYDIGWRPFG